MRSRVLVTLLAAPLAVFVLACSATPSSRSNGSGVGPQDPAVASEQAAEAAPAPTGPITAFADGIYEVGTGPGQVVPGKYKTTPPVDCYWERLKGTSGSDDIIANDNLTAGAPAIVTILKTDVAFRSKRCGTWQKSG